VGTLRIEFQSDVAEMSPSIPTAIPVANFQEFGGCFAGLRLFVAWVDGIGALASRLGFDNARAKLDGSLGQPSGDLKAEPLVSEQSEEPFIPFTGRAGRSEVADEPQGQRRHASHHSLVKKGKAGLLAVIGGYPIVAPQIPSPQTLQLQIQLAL